jgi:cytoskeletal protein CcmA (bactofilin family)
MSLWHRNRQSPLKANGVTAFIDEGSEIEGKYTFSGVVLLNGKFKGEIVSSDTLIIGEKGVIHATIRAGTVVIRGEVVGGVQANERVEMKQSARVYADVEAPVVLIEEGGLFEGHCLMTKGRPAEAAPIREATGGRETPAPVLALKR